VQKGSANGSELQLSWAEEGGPPVSEPKRRGFGSRLVQRSICNELQGRLEVDFAPSGLKARIAIPLAAPAAADEEPALA
jgi:two-component sensor histidine kinase